MSKHTHLLVFVTLLFLPTGVLMGQEKEAFLQLFRDSYIVTGIPLDRTVDKNTADVKFRVSFRTSSLHLSDKWETFIGYTQTTTWNAYGKSAPFKDNTYSPGLYFLGRLDERNTLLTGLEHQSNGRPYFGNPIASETVEDYSRGMNYAFITWRHAFGNWALHLNARASIGCGVGDYTRHENPFSQDLFVSFLGYLTAAGSYDNGTFGAFLSVTPIGNRSIANVTAEASWLFANRWPRLFLQFHYGFDEALCDCMKGALPPVNLRMGFAYNLTTITKL